MSKTGLGREEGVAVAVLVSETVAVTVGKRTFKLTGPEARELRDKLNVVFANYPAIHLEDK